MSAEQIGLFIFAYLVVGWVTGYFGVTGFLNRLDRAYPNTAKSVMGLGGWAMVMLWGVSWPAQLVVEAVTYAPFGRRVRK